MNNTNMGTSSSGLDTHDIIIENTTRTISQHIDKLRAPTYLYDKVFFTYEDFTRADTNLPVLVCIGPCGAGKSTQLNRFTGRRLLQGCAPEYKLEWDKTPLFKSAASSDSVTKHVSFATTYFNGDSTKPVILVDTPGHDIPETDEIDSEHAQEELALMASDFHNKIKALGRVDGILVMHNDIHSNRLNSATYSVLKMLDEIFANSNKSVWDNIIIAYSKCNECEIAWRSELEIKKAQLNTEIQKRIKGCERDLPIITLGGLNVETPTSDDDLNTMWKTFSTKDPISTQDLKPFEGSFAKYRKLVKERNDLEVKYNASLIYPGVVMRIMGLLIFLSSRSIILKPPLNLLLLDIRGPWDELACMGALVHSIGLENCIYSLEHGYNIWIKPLTEEQSITTQMVDKKNV